jgi:hypothetical protein
MTYVARRGDAFLIDTSNDKHLFVVVTDADKNGMHLLLSVSTIRPEARTIDRTCVIPAGAHEFIKKPSFVYYRKPEQRSAAHIAKCVDGRSFVPKEAVAPALLERICAGILISAQTPRWAKDFFRQTTPAPEKP